MNTNRLTTILCLLFAPGAFATGIMIPKPVGIPNLAIKSHRVDVTIEDQVARTHVEQVFTNHTDRQLEATFVFPLPAGASVTEFAMMMNGKRVVGEVLEKDRARQIYTDIVRRMKDPGLLEYLGNNLFKASVFPIPPRGDQKIEISYSEVVTMDAGLAEYVFPLKTGDNASTTLEDFSVAVTLKSKTPIKTIYSPTHSVDVVKKSDHEAKVGFELNRATLNQDFRLLYSVSDKEFGLNLVAHRTEGKDGYFLMMISPKAEIKKKDILPKDVCFVIDTSGSMTGKKIEQARRALQYCINSLDKRDRFNVIRFSTDVELFKDELVKATKENIDAANQFVGDFIARGGTDIDLSLQKALKMKTDEKRPYHVVFLTDGKPTIGTTDPKQIVGNVQSAAKGVRTFAFGVGHEVNTMLLDQIAKNSRAAAQYVSPDEDIEVKVSAFFDKVNAPVLANLKLDLGKLRAYDMYPKELPDLFKGNQLLVLARYKEDGDYAIKLTGELNGKKQEFVYEGTFPKVQKEQKYVPRIWANRKVGYLLEEIRMKQGDAQFANGAGKELVEEVIALGKEFGIVTPYTSYLILEDEDQVRIGQRRREGGGMPPPRPGPVPVPFGQPMRRVAVDEVNSLGVDAEKAATDVDLQVGADGGFNARSSKGDAGIAKPSEATVVNSGKVLLDSRNVQFNAARKKLERGLAQQSGQDAVAASEAVSEFKEEERADDDSRHLTGRSTAMGRSFANANGVWTDSNWKAGVEPTKVKYLSDAYFKLLEKDADLKEAFALGESVLVVLKSGKAVLIGGDGKENLTDAELAELFK